MRAGKRLFVGARLSVGAANTLAGCAETLARRARDAGVELRWVAPANYHVTLAFLGWTGVEAIRPVCDALAAVVAGEPRITFRTSRLGAFAALDGRGLPASGSAPAGDRGSMDRATVLWAGIEDGGALTRLAGTIGAAMEALGFAREARPFHPHVTIARLREARALRDVVLPMAEQMFGDTRIDAVTLFESETKSSGSVYLELEKIAFQQPVRGLPAREKRQTDALERGTPDREPDETLTDDGWPRGQGPTD